MIADIIGNDKKLEMTSPSSGTKLMALSYCLCLTLYCMSQHMWEDNKKGGIAFGRRNKTVNIHRCHGYTHRKCIELKNQYW